jgi:hypothetical protein
MTPANEPVSAKKVPRSTEITVDPPKPEFLPLMLHRDGTQWVVAGDKLIPRGKPCPSKSAPEGAIEHLLENPLGRAPSGWPLKDSFADRYGYLPVAYIQAAQAARDAIDARGSHLRLVKA